MKKVLWRSVAALGVVVVGQSLVGAPAAADNRRLNDGVVANVYTVQQQHGCTNDVQISPPLRLAAQWHANDVLHNRALDGDLGSDGSTVQDRANKAGYQGIASQTVAINPALAMNNLEIIRQWYFRPDYLQIMQNCANTEIGVWSEHLLDRTVVVAVYGQPN